jgi:SAM-dependent methyltransferase
MAFLDWAQGYNTETEYTAHFYRELLPAHLDLCCLLTGAAPPPLEAPGRFRYCELGCGNGLTLLIAAAVHPEADFIGIDFMPAHIANAKAMAAEAGLANVRFLELSFEEANALPADTLGELHYIVLHGIYSWVSPRNRQEITRFIRRHLCTGGLVYNSYNALPGWSATMPIRAAMLAKALSAVGEGAARTREAIEFVDRLQALEARAFKAAPQTASLLDQIQRQPVNYIAQEYLNQDWHPQYCHEVMEEMAAAKLELAGSATLPENYDRYRFNDAQQAFIKEQPTQALQELTRDFFASTRFRRDLFVRGKRRLDEAEQSERLREVRFLLCVPAATVKFEADLGPGKLRFETPDAQRMVGLLAEGPKSFGELLAGQPRRKTFDLILALMVTDQAVPVAAQVDTDAPTRLNRVIKKRVFTHLNMSAVVAAGTGFTLSQLHILLLRLLAEGRQSPEDLAAGCMELLQRVGRSVVKDGKPLTAPDQARAHLAEQARDFLDNSLPWYRKLGLVERGAQSGQ